MESTITVDISELTCVICLEVFKDPRILPCVHSFCFSCLDGLLKKYKSSKTICCPVCKATCPVPPGGVSNIKNNYFLTNLSSRLLEKYKQTTDHGEIACSTDDCIHLSVQYCTHGCGYLCNNCLKQHSKFRGNKNHNVIDLDDATNKDTIKLDEAADVYCTKHTRNIIDQYCVDCDFAACGTCLLQNHRQHNLVDMEAQAKISRKCLENMLQKMDATIKFLDEQMASTDKHTKQATVDIEKAKGQITKEIDKMIAELNFQKKKIYMSLDQIEKQKDKVVMTARDGLQFNQTAMTSLKSYTESVLNHGRDWDKVQQVKDIQSRLMSVDTIKISSFTWSKPEDKGIVTQTGTRVAGVSVNTVDTEIIQPYDVNKNPPQKEVPMSGDGKIAAKIPLVEQKRPVRGLVVMEQTVWIVHEDKSFLIAYPTMTPNKPQSLAIPGLVAPEYMANFPPMQTNLVISESKDDNLLWIKLLKEKDSWKVESLKSVKLSYIPRGLSVHGDQLLVCSGSAIHMLDTEGREIHRVNMPENMPWKAVPQLHSSGFVVRDYDKKQVVMATEKGNVKRTYQGEKGFWTGDIVCHGHSIYVSDYANHRLDELYSDGRHVRQLISQQRVRFPNRLCVDEIGLLYVAQGDAEKREVWVVDRRAKPSQTASVPASTRKTLLRDDQRHIQNTMMQLSVTWC